MDKWLSWPWVKIGGLKRMSVLISFDKRSAFKSKFSFIHKLIASLSFLLNHHNYIFVCFSFCSLNNSHWWCFTRMFSFSNKHKFFVKHSHSIHSKCNIFFVMYMLIVRLKPVNSKVRDDAHETIATHRQRRHDRIEVAALATAYLIRQINMGMESIAFQRHC